MSLQKTEYQRMLDKSGNVIYLNKMVITISAVCRSTGKSPEQKEVFPCP